MRWTCTVEGFSDTWIEVDDRWTRRETESVENTADETYLLLLRAKTTACHIQAGDGYIESAAELTEENLLDADEAVWGFLGRVLPYTIAQRRFLGNASLRPSLPSNGTGAAAKTTMKTTPESQLQTTD